MLIIYSLNKQHLSLLRASSVLRRDPGAQVLTAQRGRQTGGSRLRCSMTGAVLTDATKGIEVNWVKDAVSKWVTLGVKESAILCFKESVVRIRLRREDV